MVARRLPSTSRYLRLTAVSINRESINEKGRPQGASFFYATFYYLVLPLELELVGLPPDLVGPPPDGLMPLLSCVLGAGLVWLPPLGLGCPGATALSFPWSLAGAGLDWNGLAFLRGFGGGATL